MEITEVRIKLMEDAGERLHAFCSITFDDCFVIRDLKIIEGTNGPFVAMPSRKLTSHCTNCGYKNHLRAAYCNQCGVRQKDDRAVRDEDGRAKLYADIAHPINSRCREMIQEHVIASYHDELRRSKLPGYVSSYEDYDDDGHRQHTFDGQHASPRPTERREPQRDGAPIEQKKVQSAEEPRGPHKAPSHQRANRPPEGPGPHRPPGGGGFGAGIF